MSSFIVVGFRFRNKKSTILETGTITLELEDNNIYDENAVKVLVDGEHVGYVSKHECINVRDYFDSITGVECLEIFPNSAICRFIV